MTPHDVVSCHLSPVDDYYDINNQVICRYDITVTGHATLNGSVSVSSSKADQLLIRPISQSTRLSHPDHGNFFY